MILFEFLFGFVICYNYLWCKNELEGFLKGDKDWFCVIILVFSKIGKVMVILIMYLLFELGEEYFLIEIFVEICR